MLRFCVSKIFCSCISIVSLLYACLTARLFMLFCMHVYLTAKLHILLLPSKVYRVYTHSTAKADVFISVIYRHTSYLLWSLYGHEYLSSVLSWHSGDSFSLNTMFTNAVHSSFITENILHLFIWDRLSCWV